MNDDDDDSPPLRGGGEGERRQRDSETARQIRRYTDTQTQRYTQIHRQREKGKMSFSLGVTRLWRSFRALVVDLCLVAPVVESLDLRLETDDDSGHRCLPFVFLSFFLFLFVFFLSIDWGLR